MAHKPGFPPNLQPVIFHGYVYVFSSKYVVKGDLVMYYTEDDGDFGDESNRAYYVGIVESSNDYTIDIAHTPFKLPRHKCMRLTFALPISHNIDGELPTRVYEPLASPKEKAEFWKLEIGTTDFIIAYN